MQRQSLAASFKNAFSGAYELLKTERNFRIDFFFALLAVFFCVLTRTRGAELGLVMVCIMAVLSLEGMNSAIEATVDMTTDKIHPLARRAKDIAAGSVLIAALISFVIGCMVFIPKLMLLATGKRVVTEGLLPLLALSVASIVVYLAWLGVHPLKSDSVQDYEMS